MSSVKEDLNRLFTGANIVGKYIIFMVLLFLVINIVSLFTVPLWMWLSWPQQPAELITQPWSPFSYMFTHESFRHILWNMLLLWSGGRIFVDMLGEARFIKVYWLGGLIGGLLFFAVYNLYGPFTANSSYLLGASGSVLAIFVAVTAYRPNYMVQLPLVGAVKLLYVTAIFLVLTLPQGLETNMGGSLAHLGGASFGLFYGWRLRNGVEIGSWFDALAKKVMNYASGITAPRKAKMKTYAGSASPNPPRDNTQFNAQKKAEQERIDLILDKISKSGYESLSKEEKAILFNASNKQS
jgi:membrane associated rhomboid family serine protease